MSRSRFSSSTWLDLIKERYWYLYVASASPLAPFDLTASSLRPLDLFIFLISYSHLAFVNHLQQLAMEAQQAQQPTSAAYTRPRQPADSPAAALPVETLTQILQLSLHDLSPVARQTTRFAFSQVCRHWYDLATASAPDELFVADSSKAERLTTSLLASSKEKQEKVRGLVIEVEKKQKTGSRGTRVADLLLACPKLERLHLTLADSLGELKKKAKSGTLGSILRTALGKSTTITALELHGEIHLPAKAIAE